MFEMFKELVNFFNQPVIDLLEFLEIDVITLSIGFGSIEWFNINMIQLSTIIVSVLVVFITYRAIYIIMRSFVRMFNFYGWFK